MNNHKHEIVFKLNQKERIVIQAEEPLENIACCYRVPTVFISHNYVYQFSRYTVEDMVDTILETMKKALIGELKPHESLKQDIGYDWNESCQTEPDIIYTSDFLKIGGSKTLGELCTSTWIYNDQDGSIVLEITPDYPWYQCESESEAQEYQNYVPYKEWIKSYQPLIKRIIPKDVAQQWLEQARHIAHVIDENIKKMGQSDSH